ncbi:Chitinase [Sphingomonas antarctica]|uniref:YceD family protein n=1 Tax=Sphingomonas antarctica TaxID=2040274 RepID=UPI0039E827F6
MTELEFSRRIALDTIGAGERDEDFAATRDERDALARRFDWLAVDELKGRARLARVAGGVRATGRLHATIVQSCVATGAPVRESIDEAFDLHFVEGLATPESEEVELGESELDTLPIEGGAIDLGEAAAQTVALAANPYPRCADADDVNLTAGPANGAFAGLKGLIRP